MAKNISIVYLLNVPLEDDMKNTLYFANATAQHNYFNGQIGKSYTNVSYQSETRTFRCPDMIDNVRQYNYIMWQNSAYSNKWFYAFIKKMEYVSDGYTDVVFEVDPLQTYYFDITIKPSFVEREHTNDDTIGKHTLPEGLDLGEYVLNGSVKNNCYIPNDAVDPNAQTNVLYTCIQVSDYPDGPGEISPSLGSDVQGKNYGGVYSGLDYLFILNPTEVNRLIACYDKANKSGAIVAMFQVPLGVLSSADVSFITYKNLANETMYIGRMASNNNPININTLSITRPSTIDTYTPVNKKLLTYPYSYFYVSNNAGSDVIYHYEDFNGNPAFKTSGTISQGMSIKTYPTNYKKGSNKDGYDFGVTAGKLPVCAWNSDYYTNWCTQNAVNTITQPASALAGGVLGMVGSAMAGNPLGVVASGMSGITGIAQSLNVKYQASMTPDQAKGNTNSGDINVAETRFGFTFYPMSIRKEYAQIIDSWFSLYGYKTNLVKVPYVAHRQNWWYTKTIDANITGNVPNDDMNKIKQAYDNGLTFWRNPSNFLNYSVSNGIV